MFGGNEYWWAGLLIFLLFVFLNLAVFMLRDKPGVSYRIAWFIAVYLLIYKICEYTYFQAIGEHLRIPVEISAVSYLLYGFFVTFKFRKSELFALFIAVFAGLFYSLAFWISPDSYISSIDTKYLFAMAVINHHLLYFGGMLILANTRREPLKNAWQLPVGFGALLGYSRLIYRFTDYASIYGKPFVIQVMDSTILRWITRSDTALSAGGKAVYYIVIGVLLFSVMALFLLLNKLCADGRRKRGVCESYEPTWQDLFSLKPKI